MNKRRARQTEPSRWRRWLRYLYLRFVRLQATPHEISLGFSFGVFWGMFPLPGLQMLTAVVTAAIFRGSKMAAAAGTWLTNPVTTLPFTALHLHVGQTILGRHWTDLAVDDAQSIDTLLELGGDVIASYLLGCLINGAVLAIVSYFVGLPLISYVQQRIEKRRDRRTRSRGNRSI